MARRNRRTERPPRLGKNSNGNAIARYKRSRSNHAAFTRSVSGKQQEQQQGTREATAITHALIEGGHSCSKRTARPSLPVSLGILAVQTHPSLLGYPSTKTPKPGAPQFHASWLCAPRHHLQLLLAAGEIIKEPPSL
jgi:hypothetical protein